jgi:mono/diheme cytochrome c family protein
MVRNPQAIDVTSEMPQLPISDQDLADVAAYVSQL